MNWTKWTKESKIKIPSAECGKEIQPIYELNEKGEPEKTQEYNIQEEIQSHAEECELEPQIIAAKLQGHDLRVPQNGTYVDMDIIGNDRMELIENGQLAANQDERARLEAEILELEEKKKALDNPTPAPAPTEGGDKK